MFFLWKTSTIYIELLFWNAPVKVHELTLLWFGLPGPILKKITLGPKIEHKLFELNTNSLFSNFWVLWNLSNGHF